VATAIDPDARANDGSGSAGADGAADGTTEDTGGNPGAGGGWFIGGTPTSTPPQLPLTQGGAATAFDGGQHLRFRTLIIGTKPQLCESARPLRTFDDHT
jgi:hypothetical protein